MLQQFFFQFSIVLDDAVMHDGNFFIVGVMGVRIDHRRLAVSGPTGMADAAGACKGIAAVRHLA